MGSQICENGPMSPQNYYLEKVQKIEGEKNKQKNMKASTIFGGFWGQN